MKSVKILRITVILAFILLLVAGLYTPGFAKYPTRPIMWLCPWGAENESVVMGRSIAEGMSKILGEKIIVNAMPGGSGAKALKHVLSQPADGYLLLDAWVAPLIFVVLNRPDIGYTYSDFEPIGHISFMPFTLMVRKDSPWKTLDNLSSTPGRIPG